MTKKEAIQILIKEAGNNMRGVGCGVRDEISNERRERAREAARVVWKTVYGYQPDDNDLRGHGF